MKNYTIYLGCLLTTVLLYYALDWCDCFAAEELARLRMVAAVAATLIAVFALIDYRLWRGFKRRITVFGWVELTATLLSWGLIVALAFFPLLAKQTSTRDALANHVETTVIFASIFFLVSSFSYALENSQLLGKQRLS